MLKPIRSPNQRVGGRRHHSQRLLPSDRQQVHGHGRPQHGKDAGRSQIRGRLADAR